VWNPVLLVSCTTPSAREWARESARAIAPTSREVRLRDVDAASIQAIAGDVFGVVGAQKTSADLLGSLVSLRDPLALLTAWEESQSANVIVECPRPAGAIVAEVASLRLLLEVAGSAPSARELAVRLAALEQAFASGDIEWLVGCAPQPDAIDALTSQVAVAAGAGLRIRGVVIAPMPCAADGWPKVMRRAARELTEHASNRLHPVPVKRARAGVSPVFGDPAAEVVDVATTQDHSGDRLFTMTVPGLGDGCDAVGTWSTDPAYPVTHVLVTIDGTTVRRAVDATLRRCEAIDAVLAGDTITVTFVPLQGQWPADESTED